MPPQLERTPPYLQVLAHLRDRIERGDLKPGDALPSAQQIADEWEVSRPTAAKALSALQAEGLVETRQGTEARVIGPRSFGTGGERFARMRQERTALRPGERSEIQDTKLVPATTDVADALGLDPGAPVIRRRRRFLDDSGVVAFSTSWLDGALADVVPALLDQKRIPGGTVTAIETATGRRAARVRDTLYARLATIEEAKVLGHRRPLAVQVANTVLWDTDGQVIEYGVDVAAPNRRWSMESDLL